MRFRRKDLNYPHTAVWGIFFLIPEPYDERAMTPPVDFRIRAITAKAPR